MYINSYQLDERHLSHIIKQLTSGSSLKLSHSSSFKVAKLAVVLSSISLSLLSLGMPSAVQTNIERKKIALLPSYIIAKKVSKYRYFIFTQIPDVLTTCVGVLQTQQMTN